jgi:hypothetical protein
MVAPAASKFWVTAAALFPQRISHAGGRPAIIVRPRKRPKGEPKYRPTFRPKPKLKNPYILKIDEKNKNGRKNKKGLKNLF